jgi:hypothetical protein
MRRLPLGSTHIAKFMPTPAGQIQKCIKRGLYYFNNLTNFIFFGSRLLINHNQSNLNDFKNNYQYLTKKIIINKFKSLK